MDPRVDALKPKAGDYFKGKDVLDMPTYSRITNLFLFSKQQIF